MPVSQWLVMHLVHFNLNDACYVIFILYIFDVPLVLKTLRIVDNVCKQTTYIVIILTNIGYSVRL